jgi:pSer/pThr/pTyr-binding forkhead associated (FHA) protein
MPEVLFLTVGQDGEQGAAFPLPITRFPCVVGRHPACDLWLSDPMVSRRHCALWLHNGRVWVVDLGSRNGTRLNGEPLTAARPLEDGDELQLAGVPFRVRLAEPVEEEALGLHPLGTEPILLGSEGRT